MQTPSIATRFAELLVAAQSGDESAWATLYDDVAGRLLGYLRANRAPDPDDLVGEVFLHIAKAIGRFSGDHASFRSWVFTIAHRRLIDDRRKRSRRPRLTSLRGSHTESLPDDVDVADRALDDSDLSPVAAWLGLLSEDQRGVLLLRELGGLSVAQTAALVGKSEGATRVIHHRAIRRLQDHLSAEGVTG